MLFRPRFSAATMVVSGFQLEIRKNVVSGTWSNLPPPYAVIANHYYVTNQSTVPMRFYRLRRP